METIAELVRFFNEAAPLVMVVIGLFIVLMLVLMIAQKTMVPVAKETVNIFTMFRASMKELLDEQNKLHASQIAGLESRMASLECDMADRNAKIAALEVEMVDKNNKLAALLSELATLRAEKKRDTARITQLEGEVAQLKEELKAAKCESDALKAERDELQKRVITFEKTSKAYDNIDAKDDRENGVEHGTEAAKNETKS